MEKEKTGKEEFTEVSIPTSLFKKIEERIRGTEFSSVSDYVTYVLRELLNEEEEEEVFSEEDEEKIKARLRALGYID
ncbi:CopG family transcriptional regulator [Candidatus Bathyarchaeota archaeon]|nr:CopG family transcriptional regulator [Candidatus Bathyarchaeota archaeon]